MIINGDIAIDGETGVLRKARRAEFTGYYAHYKSLPPCFSLVDPSLDWSDVIVIRTQRQG